ncbi:hypothetical protein LCGC14_1691160 [marine sediment metagenome]|uniref:Uncharacterized protein n=1 Tax=marine sediment metagenome TaxID=412755 RepID=A0A0F9KKV4_9ZZZZ
MKPQFYNFIELFKENITVDHITSDLKCWNCDSESRENLFLHGYQFDDPLFKPMCNVYGLK